MVIEMSKGHKSQGIEQIPTEFFKAGWRTVLSGSQKLILLFGIRWSGRSLH